MLGDYKNPCKPLPTPQEDKWFDQFPQPMYEAVFNQHIAPINTTTPFYGPLLYWICRSIEALRVMEIGVAEGWSSFFMASAVTDEARIVKAAGMYYGVDTGDKTELFKKMKVRGVNCTFIHKDSLTVKPEDFGKDKFHLIFQDGWHSTEYVLDELELLLPYLHDRGLGYWVMHDVYAWTEESFSKVLKMNEWEYIRIYRNYGLAILRNMKNYDHKKICWPDGPQKPPYPLGKPSERKKINAPA